MRFGRWTLGLALATTGATGAHAQSVASQQSCAPARTALVLAGGAAKGFAHVGVLQVLDSLGVKPDLIVGTSVGAMVGALYASGYSAHEVDSLMRALPFEDVIRRYDPTISRQLGLLKALAVWERGRTGYRLQTGAAREGEVNALMSATMLRGNLQARGRFDSLTIPFRAIATNLVTRRAVIMADGDLALAVRASVALPVIFQPVRRDTTWLIDGGLSANVPIAQARALGAERVWVSRLPYGPPNRNAYDDPFMLSLDLVNSLFKEDTSAVRPGDVVITNPTHEFDPLDFRADVADSLIRVGRETARAAFAAAACIRPLGAPGRQARIPIESQVGSVVATGRANDEDAVLAELGVVTGRAVNEVEMARAIIELGHSERIRAVWLNPRGRAAEINFTPELIPAPRRAFGVGVAFDQFMSGRLWIGGVDRLVFNTNTEAAVIARFGNWEQDAEGFLRVHANIGSGHFPVGLGLKATHERVRRFDMRSEELPAVETNEGEFFIGLREDPAAGAWRYELMADARVWREAGVATVRAAGIRAAVFRARNDNEMAVIADAVVLNAFQRLRVDASRVFELSGTQARARVRAAWGNALPIQQRIALGGTDGFAGLHIGEMRGSQEAYGALQLKRRIAPLLSFVVEGMAGVVGDGHGFLVRRDTTDMGRMLGGFRVGFEASTPLGPIRVEEGFNNRGQRALLVRVGYWF